MNTTTEKTPLFREFIMSGRIVLTTMFICCVLYTLAVLGIGQLVTPYTANGSLLYDDRGSVIGSKAIAQGFTQPEYFWPRPSAVNYNAAATGGSNLSPANPVLHERAMEIIRRLNVNQEDAVPADLITTSGSGVDPHITLQGAMYQTARVASARGIPEETVHTILKQYTKKTGGVLDTEPIVNVLLVNIALDKLEK